MPMRAARCSCATTMPLRAVMVCAGVMTEGRETGATCA
jgi:hypothetical protein